MCTIIVRHGLDANCPTIIASNRDELYSRSASGPQVLSTTPRVVGGRDETKGGTWFGVTPRGLFVGLTNQRTYASTNELLRSRGELVLEALKTSSYAAVLRYLETVKPWRYNSFNLIFGDGVSLAVAYGRTTRDAVEVRELGPGVHVLCNDRLGSPEFPKAIAARDRVLAIEPQAWSFLRAALEDVLADRSLPERSALPPIPDDAPFDSEFARRLQAICVETPRYGTVSSTIAVVRPSRVVAYHYAPGSPATTSYQDCTALAHA